MDWILLKCLVLVVIYIGYYEKVIMTTHQTNKLKKNLKNLVLPINIYQYQLHTRPSQPTSDNHCEFRLTNGTIFAVGVGGRPPNYVSSVPVLHSIDSVEENEHNKFGFFCDFASSNILTIYKGAGTLNS